MHGRDAVEFARLHQVVNSLFDRLDRDFVRELSHDDSRVATNFFDFGDRAHLDGTATGAIRIENALTPKDLSSSRKVGTVHKLHEFIGGCTGVVEKMQHCVNHFTEIVRGDTRCHTHGNAL